MVTEKGLIKYMDNVHHVMKYLPTIDKKIFLQNEMFLNRLTYNYNPNDDVFTVRVRTNFLFEIFGIKFFKGNYKIKL